MGDARGTIHFEFVKKLIEKNWVFKPLPEKENVDRLSRELNINAGLATLLAQRGVSTFNQAKDFFRPSLERLHDPFLMKDMDLAVNRLCDAVFEGNRILIYGDYDVDGTTSVSLVYSFLKHYTRPGQLLYYLPDRYKEGYGLSEKAVHWAEEEKIQLIITLDCGIRANANARLLKEKNIDLIICDHHLPGEELPEACAVLDPKRNDCPYPYKELSGCGVGFKLLQGFCQQNTIPIEELYRYFDYVAISIAADIVPITG